MFIHASLHFCLYTVYVYVWLYVHIYVLLYYMYTYVYAAVLRAVYTGHLFHSHFPSQHYHLLINLINFLASYFILIHPVVSPSSFPVFSISLSFLWSFLFVSCIVYDALYVSVIYTAYALTPPSVPLYKTSPPCHHLCLKRECNCHTTLTAPHVYPPGYLMSQQDFHTTGEQGRL